MKKLFCLGAILALTSTSIVSFANSNEISSLNNEEQIQIMPRQQSAYAKTDNVNVRSNAGTSYSSVHKLKKGETFLLTNDKQKYANGYYWVKGYCMNHNKSGWVATKYLVFN